MRRTLRTLGIGTVAATLGFGTLLAATPATAADNTITMWVDQKRIANYREVFPATPMPGTPSTWFPRTSASCATISPRSLQTPLPMSSPARTTGQALSPPMA